MKMNILVRKAISETMGVMLFVTSIVAYNFHGAFHNLVLASTLALMILITATVSGGHLNPAVSLFMFARKSIDLTTLLAYWIAQLVGATLGLYLGYALSGASIIAQAPVSGVSQSGAFIGEVLGTTVLILLIVRLAATKREALIPFAVGLWVLSISTFTLTGGQANPAVTFALMIRDGFDQNHLMLVLAEFVGALVALLYVVLLDSEIKAKKKSAKKK